ncbi:MAG: phosphopentomutase [Clostridia bacterium]|nr:phosphopentomutase [Clostridia bacterium]
MKRIFLTVLDSLGAGEAPDADKFGDNGANTLLALSKSKRLVIPNLTAAGIGNIEGLEFLGAVKNPKFAHGRMLELSAGKDTTTGHFEIAGVVSETPLPTFPNGFDREIIDILSERTGRGILCNKPYSGTKVINDYGDEHIKTGSLIVYTSADSVFQIAAHEDIIPLSELYEICREARKILTGKWGVGRVIARPFIGESGNYTRSANRRDFSVEAPSDTMLDILKSNGKDVIAIGKISDIYAGRGITKAHLTHSNSEGMQAMLDMLSYDFCGLCFTNLVDFDMLYGHRRDIDGYAAALSEFDAFLPRFTEKMRDDDLLIVTADHGCDPSFSKSTDHTREYVPLLIYSKDISAKNLGTRRGFADIAKTVLDLFGIENKINAVSMKSDIL